MPSVSPTQDPTAEPSATPTISPTSAPTIKPTVNGDTVEPTMAPTTSPTGVPTSSQPTSMPSGSPSGVPTSSQPTRVPTGKPSGTPTTVPSSAPTGVPTTVTETSLSFNTAAKVDGINATEFMNDPALGESYIDAMAATTNVSTDSILIVNVTDADDADEERRYLSVSRELLSVSALIETKITVILEKIGKKSTEGLDVFETLSKSVSTSVASGSFGKKLQEAADLRGVTKPVAVDDTFNVVTKQPVIVQQRTATPTTTPTLDPTQAPTVEKDDDAGFSIFGLDTGASIGVLVVIVIGFFTVLGVAGYLVFSNTSDAKTAVAPVVTDPAGLVDPVLAKTNTGDVAVV